MSRRFADPLVGIAGMTLVVIAGIMLVVIVTLTYNGHEYLITQHPWTNIVMSSVLLIGISLRAAHLKASS